MINAIYQNNKIKLKLNNIDEKKITSCWYKAKNIYFREIKNLKKFKIEGVNIFEYFKWKNTSIWWATKIEFKDVEFENQWIKQIFLLILAKKFRKNFFLVTDDQDLINTFKKNRLRNIQHNFHMKNFYYYIKRNIFVLYLHGIFENIKKICLMNILNLSKTKKNYNLYLISNFPGNWIKKNNKFFEDRLYRGLNLKKNFLYLLFYKSYKKNLFNIINELKDLKSIKKKNYFFLDSMITFSDLIKVYLDNFKLYLKFLNLKNIYLQNINKKKSLDISDIVLSKFKDSFSKYIPFSMLRAISLEKFLNSNQKPRQFLTYGEIFPHNRMFYNSIKNNNSDNKIIAFQHLIASKNKLFLWHSKSDFHKKNNFINYSPKPDLYLAQGKHFGDMLKKYYPNRYKIVGSLRYIEYTKKIKKKNQIKKLIKKKLNLKKNDKLVFAAIGINDKEIILDYLNSIKDQEKCRFYCTLHPALRHENLEIYILKKYPKLNIKVSKRLSTLDMICSSDLTISCNSAVGLESKILNVENVIVQDLGEIPFFDKIKGLNIFYSKEKFRNWFLRFVRKRTNPNLKINKNLSNYYFFKVDKKIRNRFYSNFKYYDRSL